MESNDLYTLYLLGMTVVVLLATGIVLLVVVQKTRQALLLERQRLMEVGRSNALLSSRAETQERHMDLLGDEVHENLCELLLVALGCQRRARSMLPDGPECKVLDNAVELTQKCIKEVRNLGDSLNSGVLTELGLAGSVTRDVRSLSNGEMRSHFTLEGTPTPLNREQDLLIYRIVQEATQNIIRHSGATECWVILSYAAGALKLWISDNGKGFNPKSLKPGACYGLAGIRSRAALLKAEYSIFTSPGDGCILELQIPIDQTK